MSRTVVYYTDTQAFGGAEVALLNLMEGLDRRLWRPILFHHDGSLVEPLVQRARGLGVETRRLESLPAHWDIRWLARVRRQIRHEGASLFHAHLVWPLACTYGILAAWLARIPVVATQHLYGPIESPGSKRLQRRISRAVARYIAVSGSLASDLRRFISRPTHRVCVVRNSIPYDALQRSADPTFRRALAGDSDRPIVLTLARLEGRKGIGYLLEAPAQVPEALFLIAGEGGDRAKLERRAVELGVSNRVVFLGRRNDVPELLAACDLFVLPSLFEGLPLSVLEAMAAGKPVVATRIGGTNEAVEDGVTGILVPPADGAAIARAIQSILTQPAAARRMAEAGRARARLEFNGERMVRQTTELYEELLDEPRGRVSSGAREPGPEPAPPGVEGSEP